MYRYWHMMVLYMYPLRPGVTIDTATIEVATRAGKFT